MKKNQDKSELNLDIYFRVPHFIVKLDGTIPMALYNRYDTLLQLNQLYGKLSENPLKTATLKIFSESCKHLNSVFNYLKSFAFTLKKLFVLL